MTVPSKARRIFGTDGARDIANRGNMTPETAMSLGRAFVRFLSARGTRRPVIVTGRDTRRSGAMLEAALAAGMMSEGADIRSAGIFPTPGVGFLLKSGGFDAGAVISASHNPAEYNGIKFFDSGGHKLSDDDEAEIEEFMSRIGENIRPTGGLIGEICFDGELCDLYVDWLSEQMSQIQSPDWPIVIDAANGAAARIVERVFGLWRGGVSYLGVEYDGLNINAGAGVMHMDRLSSEVRRRGARLGISFDGDADRVLLCDGEGRVIDGDIMLWVIGRCMSKSGLLGSGIVATVMSNTILEEKLREAGIELFRCPVGDRYVLSRMRETGACLGGEQSGHIIASDRVTTGDGLCASALFIKSCVELGEDLDTLVDRFPRYPQVLRNLKLENRELVMASPRLEEASANAMKKLAGAGRILLRPSGTEPLLRILVEARDEGLMREVCNDLERAVLAIAATALDCHIKPSPGTR
ncbi:MAG: phosphoglucosamine mutase [Synergistaceae bacterium]|jgi:phosphoglucosamine mutase|nr:phosphoglucosamine mutase [Synergistaceae bacterium]